MFALGRTPNEVFHNPPIAKWRKAPATRRGQRTRDDAGSSLVVHGHSILRSRIISPQTTGTSG